MFTFIIFYEICFVNLFIIQKNTHQVFFKFAKRTMSEKGLTINLFVKIEVSFSLYVCFRLFNNSI